ncbi:Isocitrate lyase [Altererythrobacter epoxidivorans]|uniref:Isocitrate lyase n=1 Tax=Altererythrobacter epoxidivorans TaxID=361183 RepID=A0A0M4M7A3_9SPHN|nr:Isocitrate lyase [Altererythrobacter epoxidivorans]
MLDAVLVGQFHSPAGRGGSPVRRNWQSPPDSDMKSYKISCLGARVLRIWSVKM